MPWFGAHLSIAGGLPRAVDRAVSTGCEALQIFTKSVGQWRARPLPGHEVAEFRRRLADTRLRAVVAHVSYLVNLAAPAPSLRARSLAALIEEYDRAERLTLDAIVLHPGAHTTGTPDAGLRRIGDGLVRLLRRRPRGRTRVLLEHTAGQGTTLGHTFEQLRTLLDLVDGAPRVGICLDTCHLLAAGYDLSTGPGYAATMAALDRLVGIDRVRLFHLNDSRRPLGSRVDRHDHIGEGYVGLDGFRRVVTDPRFAELPMILETPKLPGPRESDPLDRRNLALLRRLAGGRGPAQAGGEAVSASPNTRASKR